MDLFATVSAWFVWLADHLDYTALFVLMTLEASIVPIPSEAVLIPAGYLSAEGGLDPALAFAAALAGVAVGSTFNYLLGRYVGRSFVLRYGRYFLISREAYERSEELFSRNAVMFTFLGRFIPAVRHLISIPAGMARMPFGLFMAVTLAGSGAWVAILIAFGYVFGRNTDLIESYVHDLSLTVAVVAVLALGAWLAWRLFAPKPPKSN